MNHAMRYWRDFNIIIKTKPMNFEKMPPIKEYKANGMKTKNKSVSLPKIKTQAEDISPKKALRQLHKVKWSIAPKCLLEGHEGKQIIYICINPECREQTRLVCEQCFFKDHKNHNEEFLAIDEVKKGEIEKLRYWPFQFKYRKIFEFVTKHESYVSNMVQDVNATFNSMAMRILNSIDKIRLSLLKQIDNYYLKETHKKKFTQNVKKEMQKCFELKKIGEVVRKLFSKQIRHEVFLEEMSLLLQNEEVSKERDSLLKYFNNAEKGSDMFFDKMHFLKKENWIIEQIEGQKKALKEQTVTIDEADMGIEKIVVQTIDYLNKNAEGMYPLTFQNKQLEDGSTYNGFMSHGNRTLFGMRSYKNGFVYYGEWRNNARNGWGISQNKQNGYRYAGDWKEDRKWGYGRESTLTTIYQGNFVADRKEGFGVLMVDGVRWQINWKNDKKHGNGKRIDKNGEQTEIYFLNGVESQGKVGKSSPAFDLKQLSKRFSSVKSTSG